MINASSGSNVRRRPRAWKAYKRILQYIAAHGLQPGDRLPTQPQLCQILGLCSNTLQPAMHALVADGVLTKQQRIGTVLVNAEPVNRIPWTIGAAAIAEEQRYPSSFAADLIIRVQAALGRTGCRCVLYPRRSEALPTPLDAFDALSDDMDSGDVDGLVALTLIDEAGWVRAAELGVPICHAHWSEHAPCAVLVDQASWAQQAVRVLVDRGCRRLAAGSNADRQLGQTRFWDGFLRGIQSAGLPASSGETLALGPSINRTQIDQIAGRLAHILLQRPARERPEGIVLADDCVAAHLAFVLRETSDYRPVLAVQTNRQLPRVFALPILWFDVDIEVLAQQTVDLLLQRVRNPAIPPRVEWHVPQLADPTPQRSPVSLVG